MQSAHPQPGSEPATKADLRDLKSDVDARISDLRGDMNARFADANARLTGLQNDIRAIQSSHLGLRNGMIVALLAAAATAVFANLLS